MPMLNLYTVRKIMVTLNSQRIADACHHNGDSVATIFINALEHCNWHTEAKIIETIWHAMGEVDFQCSEDAPKLVAAARQALENLSSQANQ